MGDKDFEKLVSENHALASKVTVIAVSSKLDYQSYFRTRNTGMSHRFHVLVVHVYPVDMPQLLFIPYEGNQSNQMPKT